MELLLIGAVLALLFLAFRGGRHKPKIWFDGVILQLDDLAAHGRELGKFHRTKLSRISHGLLLHRLRDNLKFITRIYRETAVGLNKGIQIAPAGEWLLDNYYIVEEQVKEILLTVKKGRFSELPILCNGNLKGVPRIYAIALEVVSHTDGDLSEQALQNFIIAYQETTPLTISELWALALMVRIALVEKIRHVCSLLEVTHRQWRQAEAFLAKTKPDKLQEKIFSLPDLPFAFAEHLLKIPRRGDETAKIVKEAVAEKLLAQDFNLEQLVHREHQTRAAQTTAMANAVSSLKIAASMDWDRIFEELSRVDRILGTDSVYGEMDFASRDYYRRRVQLLAKKNKISEIAVAKQAVAGLQQKTAYGEGHSGFYLFQKQAGGVDAKKPGVQSYILLMVSATVALTFAAGFWAAWNGEGWAVGLAVLFLLPASEVVHSLVNRVLTWLRKPAFLPKLELQNGIPSAAATLVVIPAIAPDSKRVEELLVNLERHYLANAEENLYFALLGDFSDALEQECKGDAEIIQAVFAGVKKLNEKHGSRFFALLRRRTYSSGESRWMGWERKRGALVELSALLLGSKTTTFMDPPALPQVRYVLTVDADTRLPFAVVKKLVGTITHPLNLLRLENGRPAQGYGLVQPRIGVSIESVNKSRFARVMAGPGGTDAYANAISDVYQDWFGEGIFTGKGIFDLNAAHGLFSALPENSILSHDLLEGGLLRTALATDLELVDDYPARYSSFVTRGHRWTRGDWQLLPWLLPWVNRKTNPLSLLSRWQIADNLRRSLVPISQLLFLGLALATTGSPWIWCLLFLATLIIPALLSLLDLDWPGYISSRLAGDRPLLGGPGAWVQRLAWQLTFLPYQGFVNGDAILRTLYRLLFSRKNLLEWKTAADVERTADNNYWRRFQPVLLVVLGFAALLAAIRPGNLVLYGPVLVIWLFAPVLAAKISRENRVPQSRAPEDDGFLRQLAWKTWLFYEELIDEGTCYLPPDNFQVKPATGIDKRTSPTNIGFYLLGILAARDFGFISFLAMIEAIDKTLCSVEAMEKWNGHLYNWYSIEDLKLLRPKFVSTVDSGNLACMLTALATGLEEQMDQPLFNEATVMGLQTALGIAGPEFSGSLASWEDFLAVPGVEASIEGARLLALYRTELAALFPQTEILVHPPSFLQETPVFSGLTAAARGALANPSLNNLAASYKAMLTEATAALPKAELWQKEYLLIWQDDLQRVEARVRNLLAMTTRLISRLKTILAQMNFAALYNSKAELFSIGYSVDDEKLSSSNYDLLASEARLASYYAIVNNQVPPKHWQKLGRALVRAQGAKALVSWSGTMFEYLMPQLLLKNYPNTFLDDAIQAVIKAQQSYGAKKNLPWGVSESGYYAFDYRLNYQYKAFGIPSLGLKRGLADDAVVSPYSTMLALPFAPAEAIANVRRLLQQGLGGRYGLYEAVDYTPQRMEGQENQAVVQSYFAHHQGMSLLSLVNYSLDFAMVRRFHQNSWVRAGDLMLQETPSRRPVLSGRERELQRQQAHRPKEERDTVRSLGIPTGPTPKCHLLSNGCYNLMLTDSGSGYSRNGRIQVSRWRSTASLKYGTFVFIKSLNNNRVWSAALAPLGVVPDFYRVRFFQDRASYFSEMQNIDTRMEIVVATEDNAEVRRITLTNHGVKEASLEITSFFELALAEQNSDLAHPAFNNLFVETEFISEYGGLIARRRTRRQGDPTLYVLHLLADEGDGVGALQYETDRGKFIGRGRDISNPVALNQPLTNSSGQVLDPAMSLRRQLKLGAGKSSVLTFVTAQGDSRQEMVKLAAKYSDSSAGQRAFHMAAARSLVERRFLNLSPELLAVSQQAIGHLLFVSPTRRRFRKELAQSAVSQQGLWAQGVSGDNPIVLVTVEEADETGIVEEAILAHEYWRFKGLTVDLVILHGGEGGYFEPVGELVRELVQLNRISDILDKPGGIYIRSAKKLAAGERYLFHGAARLIFGPGTLVEQLKEPAGETPPGKSFSGESIGGGAGMPLKEPLFYNGFGGFSADGREYVITLQGRATPAPWANVLANPLFGCLLTERGGGYVFAENSRENKLTPWSNDPVADPPGEAIYLRDEERGQVWTVTAAPITEDSAYSVRHGQGYSVYSHCSNGLTQELTVFVPEADPVKVSLLTVRNDSPVRRSITATYFIKPVLGVNAEVTQLHLVSEWRENILMLRNPYNGDFPGRVLWLGASLPVLSYTGDEWEFLGVCQDLAAPPALKRVGLSNTVGPGLKPGAAIQVAFELDPGRQQEIVFQLGQETDFGRIKAVCAKYSQRPQEELKAVKEFWRSKINRITVDTPELSLNLILGWLLYQTLVCRLWARTGFYQCGGAFGFRDQLQDAANLSLVAPALAKEQILLHAAHQFLEGDVQHWWHPGTNNRGVRTRFSDDLLWLPWTVADYVERTGDSSILAEEVPFLEAETLAPGVDEYYGGAEVSTETASIFEHCRRALDRSLRFGANGLPLMGSGDWNDGMSHVGNKGKGESVWLGWFLYDILSRFAPLCRQLGAEKAATEYLEKAELIRQALESAGWDGRWYRRAYFDDGTPLGSAENTECSIDSIPQSWAVLSGGGRRDRVEEAMVEVETHLVHPEEGVILLFAPPFEAGDLKPGYIKGYVPGVRENGGQYTHAACWAVQALARLGQGSKAGAWVQLLNPITHSSSAIECSRYKVEPYALAADVYYASAHKGRGGWSWYTGAAGWLYRVICEDILGIKRRGDVLIIDPCIPNEWRRYSFQYVFGGSTYSVTVLNPSGQSRGVAKILVAGAVCQRVLLKDEGDVEVVVWMG